MTSVVPRYAVTLAGFRALFDISSRLLAQSLPYARALKAYWSKKDRIFRLRLGCFSFRSAFASICRIRSRVTENC